VIRPNRDPLADSEKSKKCGEPDQVYGKDLERVAAGSV